MVSAGRGFGPIEHSQIPLIATSLSLRLSRLDRTQIATVSAILTYVWMPSLRLASASWLSSSLTFDHPCHHIIIVSPFDWPHHPWCHHHIMISSPPTDRSCSFRHHPFGGKNCLLPSPVFGLCLQFERLFLQS